MRAERRSRSTLKAIYPVIIYIFTTREYEDAQRLYNQLVAECNQIVKGFSERVETFQGGKLRAEIYAELDKPELAITTYKRL